MRVDDFDFQLPNELFAQVPLARMSLDCSSWTGDNSLGQAFATSCPIFVRRTCLFLTTKVIPARLFGVNRANGRPVEILLLRPHGESLEVWSSRGKGQVGAEIEFPRTILSRAGKHAEWRRLVQFDCQGTLKLFWRRSGDTLPPYIQTRISDPNAIKRCMRSIPVLWLLHSWAPFHRDLLGEIRALGTGVEFITLHVGLGTFRPVRAERVEEHVMHGGISTSVQKLPGH